MERFGMSKDATMRLLHAAVLAVLALLIVSCSGAPRSPATVPSGGTRPSATAAPSIPAGPPVPPPLISKALEPSTSEQTLSWSDKITISVPAGLLEAKQILAIAPAQDVPPPTFKGIGEMAGYTVTLGNLQEFKKPLTIEVAYDPAKLPEDLAPQKALFASFWDSAQKLWVYAPVTVDPQRKVVVIKTDHLTTWKVYYILRGYGVNDSDHFLVVYDKQTAAIVGSKQVSASSFANDVSSYLEQAYAAYAPAPNKPGFRMPSGQTHAFVDKDTLESQRSGLTGNIYFAMTHDSAETLMHEAAHELFHVVQNQYYNVYGMGWRGWWTEATADYAAYQVVWNGRTELSDLNHVYFNKSITARDGKHEYMTANFVAFLAGRGVNFKGAWDSVAEDGRINVLRPLETYAQAKTKTSLHDLFRQFVRYALFDPAGPVEKLNNDLLYSGVIDKPDVIAADQKETSYTFNLKPDYTAAIWGMRIQTKNETTARALHMEITGTPPSADQVQTEVIVLKNDVRPSGGAKISGTLDASNLKLDLRVVKDDVVYIVAVNSSGSNQQLTIKVTDDVMVTVSPDAVTLPPGGRRAFLAQITGTAPANARVVWTIDEGAAGGNITPDVVGMYTAPSAPGTYHVTATLATDKTKKATATVTVAYVVVKLRPETATVQAGGKQGFVAEVSGNPETRVTWKVEESDGGNITTDGVYTAPSRQGTYHVLATSRADNSVSARATVNVVVPTPTPLVFNLTLAPAEVVLLPGSKQEFRASITGLSDTRVNWNGLPSYIPPQAADIPVTFNASDLGDYTVSVTSVADPNRRVEAKVKVVPGVWVLVNKTETKSPNFGSNMPTPTGGVSLGAGSATATNQTGTASSKWRLTWTEPPTSLTPGQKFSGTLSAQDAGSSYEQKALQFPLGSIGIQTRMGSNVVDSLTAGAGRDMHTLPDYPFRPSASKSFEFTIPRGRADGPQLSIQAYAVAEVNFGGGSDWTQMIGQVLYKYELRP